MFPVMDGKLYHLISEADWAALQGQTEYSPPSLKQEGFVHLSLRSQLAGVVKRFYSHRSDLLVLVLDRESIRNPIRFEAADGDLFPHLYGPLNLNAVLSVEPLEKIFSY